MIVLSSKKYLNKGSKKYLNKRSKKYLSKGSKLNKGSKKVP